MKTEKVAKVCARAFNRETGIPVSESRIEEIDLEENILFVDCKTILDIKDAYESFWNSLNPQTAEIVFVQQISFN